MDQNNLQNSTRQISPEEVAQMGQKPMTQEELQKTQVLNLQEVEEVARYERMTSKKPAIFVAIIGILLLTFGTTFQIVTSLQSTKQSAVEKRYEEKVPETVETVPVKKTYKCTDIKTNNSDGTDTTYTISYEFEDEKLKSFTKTYVIKAITGNALGMQTIQDYIIGYKPFMTSMEGYTITVTPNQEQTQLTAEVIVDLEKLDLVKLPQMQANHFTTKVDYQLNSSFLIVRRDMTALQYTCN